VRRDIARGDEAVPEDVWEKRLFVSDDGGTILHIRRHDSPWGRYTVWFRDWLRSNAAARDRYARVKRALSAANAGKSDYDDYTLGKTAFFDDVQDAFVRWAREAKDDRPVEPADSGSRLPD
jgi:dephospho-CoA kinase